MKSVTILVPAYNEELYIESCIKSILNFSGLDKIDYEIFVIDGMSDDKTREIVNQFLDSNPKIILLTNSNRIQSSALNIGIIRARYDYIMRLDAHCIYPTDYLQKSIETAIRTDADNVGGLIITNPGGTSYGAQLVQAITTHKFGVGNSGFRTGALEGLADTVPFGFFKKNIFTKIGLFDEKLIRCQDYEFNRRILKNGGIIWMNPLIQSQYFNQSTFGKFLKKQVLKEAPYVTYMWYLYTYTFTYRHAVTGLFTIFFIIGILLSFLFTWAKYLFLSVMILYLILALFSAVQQALKFKKLLHLFTLPISFFLFHFFHGLGILSGVLKLILNISPVQKK